MQFSLFTISPLLVFLCLKHYIYVYANTDAETNIAQDDNEHRYMIKFKHKNTFQKETYKLQINGDQRLIMTLPDDNVDVMTLNTTDEVSSWEEHDDVEYVELDSKVYKQQQLESIPWGIEKVRAFNVNDDNISNQKVCIIDTGYDINHPDLPSSKDVVSGTSQHPSESWDEDGDGHGTHVAGTIAAIGGNDRGIVGISRHGQLKLHIVKIFDNDGKWTWRSDLIKAVESCVNAGSTIINMSLGGPNFSMTENNLYEKLYKEQNVILVAASGNNGKNQKFYPASYPSVISVGAIDRSNRRASFSQYNDQVNLVAPGVSILSTLPGGKYKEYDGTSMATPHVAGVAALLWSHFPTLSAKELQDALQLTAQDLGKSGRDDEYGYGLIRADLAYDYLAPGEGCVDIPYGWHDSDGSTFDCKWYAEGNRCESFGNNYENLGKTAQEACCVCGGGSRSMTSVPSVALVPITSSPTSAPVPPTSTPTTASAPPTSFPTNASVPPSSIPTVASAPPSSSPTNPSVPPSSSPTDPPVPITSPPTDAPFIATSSPTVHCKDTPPGWYDRDGPIFTCKWYSVGNRCETFGNLEGSLGKTALEACCACGGGSVYLIIPSSPPTFAPTTTPVLSPTNMPNHLTSSPTNAPVPNTSAPTNVSVSPSSSPTNVPVPATSSPSTNCEDNPPGWHDIDGPIFDCEWYAEGNRCQDYGNIEGDLGKTAQEACCVCGGGSGYVAIPGVVTSSPTIGSDSGTSVSTSAPVPPTSSPTATVAISTRCGCDTCTSSILGQTLSGSEMTLEQQLNWLLLFFPYNEKEACTMLCGDVLAGNCDECNPLVCNM